MNPYQIPCKCSLCGGPGMMSVKDIDYAWTSKFYHQDRRICESYLEAKRRQKEPKLENQPKCSGV